MTLAELQTLLAQAEFHKLAKVEAVAADPAGRVTLHLPFDPGLHDLPQPRHIT